MTQRRTFYSLVPAVLVLTPFFARADSCDWCNVITERAVTSLAEPAPGPACQGRAAIGRCAVPSVDLGTLAVRLPSGSTSSFAVTARAAGEDAYLVRGTDSYGRRLILKVVNGQLHGAVDGPNDRWDIVSKSDGPHVVERSSNKEGGPGGADYIRPSGPTAAAPATAAMKPSPAPTATSGAATADLLVLYTPEAEADLGGPEALIAHVVYLETLLNDTLAASHVDDRIRIVGIEPSAIPNDLTPSDALPVLQSDPSAAAAREAVGADLVLLLRKLTFDTEADEAGIAYVFQDFPNAADYAFGVASLGCVDAGSESVKVCGSDDVVLHEVGHMLGAGHEIEAPGSGWKPYSHAFGCGDPAKAALTIVGTRPPFVRVYSSPIVAHEGFLCGDAETADNARVIQESLPIVAAFRAAASGISPSVVIVVKPREVAVGTEVTISWFGTNVDACSASGDWLGDKTPSGTERFTPSRAGDHTFALACSNGAQSVSGLATLEVFDDTPPEVQISVTPRSVVVNEAAIVDWTASAATNCSATGAWSGDRPLTGQQSVSFAAPGQYTLGLTCEGPGGSTNAESVLTVHAPPSQPNSPSESRGGGGGATGLGMLALLFASTWIATNRRVRVDSV